MKFKLAALLSFLLAASTSFAATNYVYAWDTFTDVKAKLAGGVLSGSGTNNTTILGGGANSLVISNFATVSLSGTTNLQLVTPAVIAGTGVVGQVLKLQSATTGKVEFGAPYTYVGSKTFDFPSVDTNGVTSTTVTVTGALPGDFAYVSLSTIGTNAVVLTGNVSATNTVTVGLFNPTAAAVDLASGTLRAATTK